VLSSLVGGRNAVERAIRQARAGPMAAGNALRVPRVMTDVGTMTSRSTERSMRSQLAVLIAIVAGTAACGPTPPEHMAPRTGTPVAASQSKTWDVVIQLFAERSLPIKNTDRASGFISTDPMGVSDVPHDGVDCGKDVVHIPNLPRLATYSVFVRGDSSSSTVTAAVHWTSRSDSEEDRVLLECTTTGVWEQAFERDVKARAEGQSAMNAAP
jgi:hypothetical protein